MHFKIFLLIEKYIGTVQSRKKSLSFFFYQKFHQPFLLVSEEQIKRTGGCHNRYGPDQMGQSPYEEVSLEKE